MTDWPGAVLFDARRTLLHIDAEELLADLAAEGGPAVGFDDHDVHAALILADDAAAPGTTAETWRGLLGLPESAAEACARALARAHRRHDLDPHARTVLHTLREHGVRIGALVDDPEQLAGLPTPDVVVPGT
jgi:FMN phosphatase YigB (HAD superfamily)